MTPAAIALTDFNNHGGQFGEDLGIFGKSC